MPGKRVLIGGLLSLLVLIGGLAVGLVLIRQRQQTSIEARYTELLSLPVNVTDTSIGVWWKSDQTATGCITLTDVDTGQKFEQCDQTPKFTHLINIGGLTPEAKYRINIDASGKNVLLSDFFGSYTQTSPQVSHIEQVVKGVVTSNKMPLAGATVFMGPNLTDRFQFPQATQTDLNGSFSIDITLFFYWDAAPIDSYFIEVTDADGRKLIETTKTAAEVATGQINLDI